MGNIIHQIYDSIFVKCKINKEIPHANGLQSSSSLEHGLMEIALRIFFGKKAFGMRIGKKMEGYLPCKKGL